MPKRSRLSETPPNAAAVPGVTFRLHMPSPRTIAARSSMESWAINASIVHFPVRTSFNSSPWSPVYGIGAGSEEIIRSFMLTVLVGTGSYSMVYAPLSAARARMRTKDSSGAIASSHCASRSVSSSSQPGVPWTGISTVSRTLVPMWKWYIPASRT